MIGVYKLPKTSDKKDFIYNILGSMVNAAVSIILLVVVSRVLGGTASGIFSLAYSTAQMMYTVCVFEMRNIQVTDAKREYKFNSVFMFRILTTIGMAIFFVVFAFINKYSGEKLLIISLLTIYMSILSFSDLFQGNMHFNGYLFIAGRGLACQVAIATIGFSIALLVTEKLALSIVVMIILATLWMLLHDVPFSKNFDKAKPKMDFATQIKIFYCAAPLFLASFLLQYIFNAPKYAIDNILSPIEQSHYGYLVMPTFFINLLSVFVFRPQLVPLSQNWASRNFGKFIKTTGFLYAWIGAVSILAVCAGYVLGIPVLGFLYGSDLSGKESILAILLVAGSFSAACSLTSTLITIMRKQKYCIVAYVVAFAISLILPNYLVSKFEMKGAAISYLLEMAFLFIMLMVIFVILFNKERKAENV